MTISNSAGATANLVLSAFNYSAPQYTRSGSSSCNVGRPRWHRVQLHPDGDVHAYRRRLAERVAVDRPQRRRQPGPGHAHRHRHAVADQSRRVDPGLRQRPAGRAQAAQPGGRQHRHGHPQLHRQPVSPAAKTGAAAADYAVTGTCILGTPLAALGGTCTLTVTLTPSALGAAPGDADDQLRRHQRTAGHHPHRQRRGPARAGGDATGLGLPRHGDQPDLGADAHGHDPERPRPHRHLRRLRYDRLQDRHRKLPDARRARQRRRLHDRDRVLAHARRRRRPAHRSPGLHLHRRAAGPEPRSGQRQRRRQRPPAPGASRRRASTPRPWSARRRRRRCC